MSRKRATAVKELNATVYIVFFAPRAPVSRHDSLHSLHKQTLGSFDLPSMLKPRGLYRTDVKSPDGVTVVPREMSNQLVPNVTLLDDRAPVAP